MATAGYKKPNLAVNSGQSWIDSYAVTNATAIAGAEFLNVGANGKNFLVGFWTGAGAITTSWFNNMPIGTVILDYQAYKTHYKTAATTWKSSAAAT